MVDYMERSFNGFYKVSSKGYSISIDTFFNPTTNEEKEFMTWDIDDVRVEIDNSEWYNLPLVEKTSSIYRQWLHKHNVATIGDKVLIARGRKMKGEIKTIKNEFRYIVEGTYGHGDIDYWTFTDGTKCAKHNCDLVKEN